MESDTDPKLEQAEKDFEVLFEELRTLNPDYTIVEDGNYLSVGKKAIRRKTPYGLVDVYAESYYGGMWSDRRVKKVFVRIECSRYKLDHKRNWTFATKDLADKVHNKCTEILTIMESSTKEAEERKKQEAAVEKEVVNMYSSFLDKDYDVDATCDDAEFRLTFGGNYYDQGIPSLKANYDNENKLFSIQKTSDLTKEQFDKIIAIIKGDK